MRLLLRDGELAAAGPRKLRYRLLHVTARLTRDGRRLRLRISATSPQPSTASPHLPRPAD
ncbi:hypothetical protein ACH4VS_09810 [Streptomyces hygroscopicus]|uniref:hypothetical protein n=1 Tax=Streptomyces hygroscopicus TaxID=1912 RepID=UPI000830B32D